MLCWLGSPESSKLILAEVVNHVLYLSDVSRRRAPDLQPVLEPLWMLDEGEGGSCEAFGSQTTTHQLSINQGWQIKMPICEKFKKVS